MTIQTKTDVLDIETIEEWERARAELAELRETDHRAADELVVNTFNSLGVDHPSLVNLLALGHRPITEACARALLACCLRHAHRVPWQGLLGLKYAIRLDHHDAAARIADLLIRDGQGAGLLKQVAMTLLHHGHRMNHRLELLQRVQARLGDNLLIDGMVLQKRVEAAADTLLDPMPPLTRTILSNLPTEARLGFLDGGATKSEIERKFSGWPADRWYVVGFDLHPDAVLSTGSTDNVTFLRQGLAGSRRTVTLRQTAEPSASSVYEPNVEYIQHLQYANTKPLSAHLKVLDRVELDAVDLDTWCHENGVVGFDFMKLNIQGAELDAMAGAPQTMGRCLGVQCEVNFAPIYKDAPLFRDLDKFMTESGFQIFDIRKSTTVGRVKTTPTPHPGSSVGAFRWPSRQLAEAHVLYLRDPFRPDQADEPRWNDPDAWLRLAVVAEMNGQVDFACQLCETVLSRFAEDLPARGDILANGLKEAEEAYKTFANRFY